MEIVFVKVTGWEDALDAARTTVNKSMLQKQPSDNFKRSVLGAEHSPIREVRYLVRVDDVPKYVTTHIVRHHEGIEKFVGTQREDRTGSDIPESELPQGAPANILVDANAQAIINISKVRLCRRASVETRAYWRQVLSAIQSVDNVITDYCVPTCVYRGFCPEDDCCGYVDTLSFKKERAEYLKLFKRVKIR